MKRATLGARLIDGYETYEIRIPVLIFLTTSILPCTLYQNTGITSSISLSSCYGQDVEADYLPKTVACYLG